MLERGATLAGAPPLFSLILLGRAERDQTKRIEILRSIVGRGARWATPLGGGAHKHTHSHFRLLWPAFAAVRSCVCV